VTFDNDGSPWYTTCSARGPDRPGLLHALTAAFAAAGVSVHAARVATDGLNALDTFDLTDRRGAKLDERATSAVSQALIHGAVPSRRRLWSRRSAVR
jgi:[protein-PII] uridylyltransferase